MSYLEILGRHGKQFRRRFFIFPALGIEKPRPEWPGGPVSTLGYPARGPASWRRRSEFPILAKVMVNKEFMGTLVESQQVSYDIITERGKQAAGNLRQA